MTRWNLIAALLIGALFATLAVLPATRDIVRFDTRAASGDRPLARILLGLGIKEADFPGGFGPPLPRTTPEPKESPTAHPDVRLADAIVQPSAERWIALQRLADALPDDPPVHAALCRFACLQGGSVAIRRDDEVQAAIPSKGWRSGGAPRPSKPEDIDVLLRAAAAGERLEPDNAFFPAMAAVGLAAAHRDDDAHAALHRAASKPVWEEHLDAERNGMLRRAALLHGPQPTIADTARMAAILFPHYAQLRALARLTLAQAVVRERAGDVDGGLVLRRDLWKVGAKMRVQGSSAIANLVGVAIVAISGSRIGGEVLPEIEDDDARQRAATDRTAKWLAAHGAPGEAQTWRRDAEAGQAVRQIVQKGSDLSAFGLPTLIDTEMRLFTGMALHGAVVLLCGLGALAWVLPVVRQWAGRGAVGLTSLAFVALLGWTAWNAFGNVRDMLGFTGLIQGLSGDSDPEVTEQVRAQISHTALTQARFLFLAVATPEVFLGLCALFAKLRGVPTREPIRRWALPLALGMTLVYGVHAVGRGNRERTVRAELVQMGAHEGKYLAGKLGEGWPE